MRHTVLLMICFVFLISSCTTDPEAKAAAKQATAEQPAKASELTQSSTADPNAEIVWSTETTEKAPQWVADILKSDTERAKCIKCIFKGENRYLVNTCVSCPVQTTEVFNDRKELLCYIGGTDQKITCDDGFADPGKRDCKPVFLK